MKKELYKEIIAKVTAYNVLTDMPIAIYNQEQECLISLNPHDSIFEGLEMAKESYLSTEKSIVEFKNESYGHFTKLYVRIQKEAFHILLGPYIYERPSKKQLQKLNLKKKYQHMDMTSMEIYFAGMKKIVQGAMIQHFHLLEKTLEYEFIGSLEKLAFNDTLVTQFEYREIDFFHHYYLTEKLFLNNMFHQRLKVSPADYIAEIDMAILSEDILRNEKNLRIVSVGVVERTAIDLGLDYHLSFTIADAFIRRLEKAKGIAEIELYTLNMLKDYSAAFHKERAKKYSKTISDGLSYIDRNLGSDLSLKSIAGYLQISHEHLSRLFKKEVGMNVKDYILSEKIKEAKIHLDYSTHTLQEISDILNFSSKSYFIRCFKKVVGVTPLDYKNKDRS